jgi:hypothetical protein
MRGLCSEMRTLYVVVHVSEEPITLPSYTHGRYYNMGDILFAMMCVAWVIYMVDIIEGK